MFETARLSVSHYVAPRLLLSAYIALDTICVGVVIIINGGAFCCRCCRHCCANICRVTYPTVFRDVTSRLPLATLFAQDFIIVSIIIICPIIIIIMCVIIVVGRVFRSRTDPAMSG